MVCAEFVLGSLLTGEKSQELKSLLGDKIMDPISDFFIRIKNAQRAGHQTLQISYSKFKHELAKALERAGLVGKIDKRGKRVRKTLEICLLYNKEKPVISDLKLISKPGQRLYSSYQDLKSTRDRYVVFLSTSKGVLSGSEAKKIKAGGELMVKVEVR